MPANANTKGSWEQKKFVYDASALLWHGSAECRGIDDDHDDNDDRVCMYSVYMCIVVVLLQQTKAEIWAAILF